LYEGAFRVYRVELRHGTQPDPFALGHSLQFGAITMRAILG